MNDHIENMIFSIKHSTSFLPLLFHSTRFSTDVIISSFFFENTDNRVCIQAARMLNVEQEQELEKNEKKNNLYSRFFKEIIP